MKAEKETNQRSHQSVASHAEWLAARIELLKAEKESLAQPTRWRGGGRSCRGFGLIRHYPL